MKKRILSLLLVAVMAVGMMVGCGKKEEPAPTPSTKQEEQKDTAADASSVVEEEVDLDSLPTLNVLFTHAYMYESDDNVIWNEVAKTIGAKVHFITADTDKRNSMIASGEGYDILASFGTDMLTQASGGGLLALDDLLSDECKADMGPYLQDSINRYSPDGKIYWLPYGAYTTDNGTVGDKDASRSMIRWDLYKEMGAPEVKTFLDLADVLADMVEKYPTNDAGETAYAVAIPSEATVMMNHMMAAPGAALNQNATGKVVSWSFQDMSLINSFDPEKGPFFYGAKFYNKCWNLGIMDPDSFAMAEADMKAKADAGTIYSVPFSWQYTAGAPFMAAPMTVDGPLVNLNPKRARGTEAFSYGQAINAKTKLVDEAAAYMNLIHTNAGCNWILNGLEGVHWEMVDGKRQYTDYAWELWNSEGHEDWYKEGLWHAEVHNMLGVNQNTILDDGQALILHKDSSQFVTGLSDVQKDFCEFYGVDYPAQYYAKLNEAAGDANNKDPYVESCLPAYASAPDDIKQLEDAVMLEAEGWVSKLVKCKESEFDKVQADCLAALEKAGLSKVFKYYQDNWDAAWDAAEELKK